MNIRKDLKIQYKKFGVKKIKTVEQYKTRKAIIDKYYSTNKDELIKDKEALIKRYNNRFGFSNRNPVNGDIIGVSVFAGVISSIANIMLSDTLSGKALEIGQMLASIISATVFIVITVPIVAFNFRQNILDVKIRDYEMDIIERFLDEDDEKFLIVRVKQEM